MKTLRFAAGGALALLLGGCIDTYMPEVVESPNSFLVVDGFINGNGRTRIKLSRSINIATATAPPAVRAAVVNVVDDQGRRYLLRESSVLGTYVSDSLQLSGGRQYKLTITVGNVVNAPQYESALVPMKVTPPLDQVRLARQGEQVDILLSTHDDAGQSRYYRWGFTETWEFNSNYTSRIEFRGGIIQSRITPIYTCWRTERSSLVKQGSTASLSRDVVQDYRLASFSDKAERVKIRYSVLVTQYAETPEEFAYNEILRKNTEAVGTVNDPLPSQLTGNVRRLGNSGEVVLGFVGAHTVVQRRIFATPTSLGLPSGWPFEDPYASCVEVHEDMPEKGVLPPNQLRPPRTRVFADPDYVPTYTDIEAGGDTVGYFGSSRYCVDCRARGTNVKPSYW